MATTKRSPFRKGASMLDKKVGSGDFLSVAADETVQLAMMVGMDQMLSADMHEFWEVNPFISFPCLGDKCPGCELGNPVKFKAYLPVLTRESQVKIYSFGISVARQLAEIEDEIGSLAGKVFRIKRTGTGLKTKYQAIPVGKSIDVNGHALPEIENKLGPTDRAKIVELLVSAGLMEEPEAKPVRRGAGAVSSKAKDEDEKSEDDEFEADDAEEEDWGDV